MTEWRAMLTVAWWKQFLLTTHPTSFLTIYLALWIGSLCGAGAASYEAFGGLVGLAMALMMWLPVPFLLWAFLRQAKRDREVKPLGTA